VTVLAVGWLLGGQVGVGTALEALLIGPMVAVTIPFFARRARVDVPRPATADDPATASGSSPSGPAAASSSPVDDTQEARRG